MSVDVIWGLVAGSSFLLGGLVALRWRLPAAATGLVLSLGAGALLGAVAYELVEEAGTLANGSGRAAAGLTAGAVVSYAIGGNGRFDHPERSSRWLLGSAALDVACEAIVIVGSLLHGHGVDAAIITAVFLCGLPSAVAWTNRLGEHGYPANRIVGLWVTLVIAAGAFAGVAHVLLDEASDGTIAFVLAFAAGALFVTVLGELLPTARQLAGAVTSLVAVLGFGLSFFLIELR